MTLFWVLSVFIGFFSNVLYTHYLPKAAFGNFTLMRTIINLLAVYSMFGFNHGLLRQGSIALGKEREDIYDRIKNYTFTYSLVISLVLCVIIFVFANPIATYLFRKPSIANLIRFCSITVPIQLTSNMVLVLFRVNKQADRGQFLYTILYFVVQVALFYGLTFFCKDETLVILTFVGSNLIYYAILFYYQRKFKVKTSFTLEKEEKKGLFKISVPMFFAATFNQSQKWGDTLFLGILGSNADVGIYYIALRIGAFVSIPMNAFNQIFTPIAGRLIGKGEHRELNDLYKTVTRIIFICGSLIFGLIYFLQDFLLNIFGKGYQDAGKVILIILISETVDFGVGAARDLITMSGGGKINMINSMITLCINVISSWLLIPHYGIIGAAIANAVTNISINLISVVELMIIYKLSPFNKKYFFLITCFIICIVAVSYIPLSSFWKAIIFVLAIIPAYVFSLNKEEKNLFIGMVGDIGKKFKKRKRAYSN